MREGELDLGSDLKCRVDETEMGWDEELEYISFVLSSLSLLFATRD